MRFYSWIALGFVTMACGGSAPPVNGPPQGATAGAGGIGSAGTARAAAGGMLSGGAGAGPGAASSPGTTGAAGAAGAAPVGAAGAPTVVPLPATAGTIFTTTTTVSGITITTTATSSSAAAPSGAAPAPSPPTSGSGGSAQNSSTNDVNLDDAFKSGKLIRYGVTGGAALAVHVPVNHKQEEIGVSAMPYLAVFPGWWAVQGSITKAYCADMWLTAESSHAQDVANALAKSIATQRKQADDPQWDATKNPLTHDDIKKYADWDTDLAGRCTPWRALGVYWGLPTSFTVNARASTTDEVAARAFSPYSSLGIAFAPLSVLSLTAGVTWSHVNNDPIPTDADPKPSPKARTIASLTFGLGGNLDLVPMLFGK